MKTCRDCKQELPLEDFQRYWNKTSGAYRHTAMCKPCRGVARRADVGEKARSNESRRKRYRDDPEYRARKVETQRVYFRGIDNAARDAMLASQGGRCAACDTDDPGSTKGWVVDHDHQCCSGLRSCGKCNRAILCHPCNLALGHIKDSPDRAMALAAYLLSFQSVLPDATVRI